MVSADNVQQTYYPCVIRIFLMSVTWGQWLMWLWKATAWTACKNTQLTWINRYESTTSWLIPCVVLKEIHYAHFQVHSIVIGYYYDKFTCLNVPKTHHVFQIVQCCSFVSPSVLAPVSLKPLPLDTQSTLIGQLTHAWCSGALNNRAAVQNQVSCAKLAADCVNVWLADVVTESKWGELLTRRFRSSVSCGTEELLLVQLWPFWLPRSFYMQKNL